MHAFGHLFNECLVNKGTAHKLIYPRGNPHVKSTCKTHMTRTRKNFPKSEDRWESCLFRLAPLPFIGGTDGDQPNSLVLLGAHLNCVSYGLMLVTLESWLFSCDEGNILFE